MNILNLYAGIGGNRKLWGEDHKVTAIENNKEIAQIYQNLFPNDIVIIEDAHQYLLEHIQEFDFIWSSPPCPTHSVLRRMGVYRGQCEIAYPNMSLYQEIILLKYFCLKTGKWVIENVIPYYESLIKPTVILDRHYFWSNFYIRQRDFEKDELDLTHVENNTESRFGFNIQGHKIKDKRTIMRNLVNPEIGLYLLEQALNDKKPLFNFNY
jgi:DNA (cytosine-5)-methyltransferase 1